MIKECFANYALRSSSVTFDFKENTVELHYDLYEPWKITLVETCDSSMTGGRIKRAQSYIGDDTFCLTYGDGVANVNISELIDFHVKQDAVWEQATL